VRDLAHYSKNALLSFVLLLKPKNMRTFTFHMYLYRNTVKQGKK